MSGKFNFTYDGTDATARQMRDVKRKLSQLAPSVVNSLVPTIPIIDSESSASVNGTVNKGGELSTAVLSVTPQASRQSTTLLTAKAVLKNSYEAYIQIFDGTTLLSSNTVFQSTENGVPVSVMAFVVHNSMKSFTAKIVVPTWSYDNVGVEGLKLSLVSIQL